MARWKPFVRKDSYMPNNKMTPLVIGNGYTTVDGASGPAPEYETVTGNPVSFNAITPFPLRQLSVAFSPVQDLHGYDAPWPAGGGANKWDEETTLGYFSATGLWQSVDTNISSKNPISVEPGQILYMLCPTAAMYIEAFTEAVPSGISASDKFISRTYVQPNGGTYTVPSDCYAIHFNIGGVYGTTYNHDVAVNYPSSVTTYSPYSNECPISGWSSLTVTIANQNVVSESFNKALGQSGGSYVVTNTAGTSLLFRCVAGTTYYLLRGAGGNRKIWGFFKDKPAVSDFVDAPTVDAWSAVAPLTGWCMVYLKNAWDETLANTSQVSITEESTVVPPVTRSISISLGETVYSGYVDVVTGVVTVTHGIVDMGSQNLNWHAWNGDSEGHTFAASITGLSATDNHTICSCYKAVESQSTLWYEILGYDKAVFAPKGNIWILARDSAFTDASAFKTAVTGQTIVYELAEPLTIQLTPQEVNSLAGDNTMWSNANQPITVEYRKN